VPVKMLRIFPHRAQKTVANLKRYATVQKIGLTIR